LRRGEIAGKEGAILSKTAKPNVVVLFGKEAIVVKFRD
jgi:hypothetical protein